MKKILILITLVVAGVVIPFCTFAQQYSLTVTITGLHSNNGKVVVYLYNSDTGFPQDHNKAYRTLTVAISNDRCVAEFNNLPAGTYAVACFHDENGNGKLDTNFLGIPDEGVGASNNAKGFMGPPKFKDAKFAVDKNTSASITISY